MIRAIRLRIRLFRLKKLIKIQVIIFFNKKSFVKMVVAKRNMRYLKKKQKIAIVLQKYA
jgi:hypothetical protein